ncbi:hypothetical protein EDD29_7592 [Actinocorallia herbida]|uniref:Uncharacterized protein n=1 Tax=Actinocorallia herbida TaxID=58109 RepID=A0A3N1D8M4_9ACTN|nr:hypothetical protein EDD29_7592 [Actinocorallia herbida]
MASVLPVLALSGWAIVGLALLSTGSVPPTELTLAAPQAEHTLHWAEVPEPTRVAAPRLSAPEVTTAGTSTPLSSRPGAVGGVRPDQQAPQASQGAQDAAPEGPGTEPQSAPDKPRGDSEAAEGPAHPASPAAPVYGPSGASEGAPAHPAATPAHQGATPAPHPADGHGQPHPAAAPSGGGAEAGDDRTRETAGAGRARGPLRHLIPRAKPCGKSLRALWRCPNLPVSLRLS